MEHELERIRAFNRFYTEKIGLVTNRFLNSGFSLVQARVLYELSLSPSSVAKNLAADLSLDTTYVSKMLTKFESQGLIAREAAPEDSRKQLISLTATGEEACETLKEESNRRMGDLIKNLSWEECEMLITSMDTINSLLDSQGESDLLVLRHHRPGDIGFIIHRHGVLYGQEYGFNTEFEGYLSKGFAAFVENFNGQRECLWVAELGSAIVGSVGIFQAEDGSAQLRWFLVEPSARGRGIGRRLVQAAVDFSREKGYGKIVLWTIDFLHAARKLYSEAGFVMTETRESCLWGKDLVEEKWELIL